MNAPFSAFFIGMEGKLSDLQRGSRAIVCTLCAGEALARRLRALGLEEGARIMLLHVSARRRVFYVRTGSTVVALGAETADMIGVRA